MRKKGFTLVELLVVIAIIALLMGILMPALARVRMIAYRMVCGTNLAGIGKAILLYAGDTKEAYPLAGLSNSVKQDQNPPIAYWIGPTPAEAYQSTTYPGDGEATIGSCFYLLVKYEDVSVKQFNCKGDVGVRTFKLTDYPPGGTTNPPEDFTKVFDFGRAPGLFCSYSYHQPFAPGTGVQVSDGVQYQVNANSPPSAPLAADRNPMFDTNVTYINSRACPEGGGTAASPEQTPCETWDPPAGTNSYVDKDNVYNSFAHQREGQNVLFNDGHVGFSKNANVGIDNDNIWQKWCNAPEATKPKPKKKEREACGLFPTGPRTAASMKNAPGVKSYDQLKDIMPKGPGDALLINEAQNAGIWPP